MTAPDYGAALRAVEALSVELRKMPAGGRTLYDVHARHLAMPFRTLDERDEWEKAHAAGTGHRAFIEAHA